MGWKYHSLTALPKRGDIVTCLWPYREDRGRPGSYVRLALVREREARIDPDTHEEFGVLTFSKITGVFDPNNLNPYDLYITDWQEVREVGLHKPSRFSLDPQDKRQAPWCHEYFAPQPHVINRGIVIGRLSDRHMQMIAERLKMRPYRRPPR